MGLVQERLAQAGWSLFDGSKGVVLNEHVEPGGATDELNLTKPEVVLALHKAYVEAGADFIQTNTFGGNLIGLGLHGLADKVGEINRAGAQLAKEAVQGTEVLVAGSIGPTGRMLRDEGGDLTQREMIMAFVPQVRALCEGGVDVLHIETMSSKLELVAALKAMKEEVPQVPVFVTMTFNHLPQKGYHRTDFGVTPKELAGIAEGFGALAYGANCGVGPATAEQLMKELGAGNAPLALIAKLNAGMPPEYATPAEMAEYALKMHDLGIRVIGGCCGTRPTHIEAMANRLANLA